MNTEAWEIIRSCFSCIGVIYVISFLFCSYGFKEFITVSSVAFIMVVVLLLIGKFFFSA